MNDKICCKSYNLHSVLWTDEFSQYRRFTIHKMAELSARTLIRYNLNYILNIGLIIPVPKSRAMQIDANMVYASVNP